MVPDRSIEHSTSCLPVGHASDCATGTGNIHAPS